MRYSIYILIGLIAFVSGVVLVYYGIAALQPETYEPERIQPTITTSTPALAAPPPAPLITTTPLFATPTSTPNVLELRKATEDEITNYQKNLITHTATVQAKEVGMEGVQALQLSPSELLVSEPASAYITNSVWLYTPKTKSISPIVTNTHGALVRAFEQGSYFLIFSLEGERGVPTLIFRDRLKNRDTRLVYTTLPAKCALNISQGPVLYCAIPQNITENTILPDDYLMRALYTRDRFVKIDFRAAQAVEIINPTTPIDAYNIEIANNTLLFANRIDGGVYAVTLQ